MQLKHTPGPWRATGRHVVAEETEDRLGMTVQIQQGNREDTKANLRLIAAAPELLAALINLLAMCERQTDFNDDGDGATFEHCRAAIAKATGGTKGQRP